MIFHFMILRSVTDPRCVTCYKLDLECACNVSYVLLCAHASCIDGELCVVFCLQIAEFTQIVSFYVFICSVH